MANLITPPDELVRDWARFQNHNDPEALWRRIATLAARWGADQELEACCKWTAIVGGADALRAARRPQPPSLKELALAVVENSSFCDHLSKQDEAILRRALEALPND